MNIWPSRDNSVKKFINDNFSKQAVAEIVSRIKLSLGSYYFKISSITIYFCVSWSGVDQTPPKDKTDVVFKKTSNLSRISYVLCSLPCVLHFNFIHFCLQWNKFCFSLDFWNFSADSIQPVIYLASERPKKSWQVLFVFVATFWTLDANYLTSLEEIFWQRSIENQIIIKQIE